MSQSPENSEDKNNPNYRRGWAKIFQMIRSGASWSGHERNCAYLNTGDGGFANISVASGIDFPDDGRGLAFSDWDHDGDLDFWISNRTAPRLRFMRNDGPLTNHFVTVRLLGKGKTTNHDAIGARVEVYAEGSEDRPIMKTLRAGEGFLSQNSKWLHFGLGNAPGVSRVVVHWPGGKSETFDHVVLDTRQILAQGSGVSKRVEEPKPILTLFTKEQDPVPYSDQAVLRLITPLEVPNLAYQNWTGSNRIIDTQNGKPKLINLWASWCLPCLKELQDFSRSQEKIEQAGLDILALSVDGLNDERSTYEDAEKQSNAMNLPFSTGRATIPLLNTLQSIHDLQTPVRRPLPLPTSFLIDAQGRLITIYKGPVDVDEVLKDLNAPLDSPLERFDRAAILPGRTLDDEPALATLNGMEALKYRKFADFFRRLGQKKYAVAQLKHIVDIWPESAGVRTELASALLQSGRDAEALKQLEATIRIEPDYPPAQVALAKLLLKQNRTADALTHFDKANALQPENPEILFSRGIALSALGKTEQAIDDFTQVVLLAPHFVPVFHRRGANYEKLGKFDRAEEDFNQAITLNPKDAQGYNNLAWLQATCFDPAFRDGKKALANAKKAMTLFSNDNFFVLDTMAAAYAEAGQYKKAVEWQLKAIQRAPENAREPLTDRLKIYRSDKPYRAPTGL